VAFPAPGVEFAVELLFAFAAIFGIVAVELAHVAVAPAAIMIVGVGAETAAVPGIVAGATEHHAAIAMFAILPSAVAIVAAIGVDLAMRSVAVAEIAVRHVYSPLLDRF